MAMATASSAEPSEKAASVSIKRPVRDRLRMTTAASLVAERAATSSRKVRRRIRLRSADSMGSAIWASSDLTTVSFGERLSRSEEHTSELQSLMRISYAVFCLKKKKQQHTQL